MRSFGSGWYIRFIRLGILLSVFVMVDGYWLPKDSKACYGTENGMATQSDRRKLIKDLREMYTNCTSVYGNLEITGITLDDLKKEGLDSLDFFDNIEEVAGYVLIYYNMLPRISFPRLRIIWGDKTFTPQKFQNTTDSDRLENFSLAVIYNHLEVLDLRSLRSVVEGRIGFFNTSGLCHWKTKSIDWTQVLGYGYEKQNRLYINVTKNDTCLRSEDAGVCSNECKYCWGPEAEHCQEIYRTDCAPQCLMGMCYNTSNPLFCCSTECAAGCYGPGSDQCYGCRSMRDNGVCVDKCPAREVYNTRKMEYERNPNGKYAWIRDCVKTCPNHLFVYKDGCVARCPEGYYAESNETVCKRCEGPCPKTCVIEKALSSLNLHEFVNCTVIDGRLEIRQDTMNGGRDVGPNGYIDFPGLKPEDLEVLSGVERITHYLFVQSEGITSLKFLRNLKQIDGRKKYQERYAFYMTRVDEMRELGLTSLKRVLDGDVYVDHNSDLCYVYTLPWNEIASFPPSLGDNNRKEDVCRREGRICDKQCDPMTGCWGSGPNMCFLCQFFKANQTCVSDCGAFENLYPQDKICQRCHDECVGCKGPGPKNCISCKNVVLDTTCVEKCPADSHYENKTEKRCLECHRNCKSCTGPDNTIGNGGCTRCRYAAVHSAHDNITSCLPELPDEKDFCRSHPGLENYYGSLSTTVGLQAFADRVCLPCHPACETCSAFGTEEAAPSECKCKNLRKFYKLDEKFGGNCILERPMRHYNVTLDFYPCHKHCEECYGPSVTDCAECRGYKDYVDREKNLFNCTDQCPDARPFITKENSCTDVDETKQLANKNHQTQLISGIVLSAVFVLLIIVCTVSFVWRRRAKNMKYLEPFEPFEMHPEAKPNLARLQLILENQLKKGQILGYGAFGTVFRGFWYAGESEKKTKVLVAIKVLHESNATAQKEMLNEAAIMASVKDPYLAPLIGVCVGQQLMLVTPLFPLGNLLDYVQSNKAKIGSLALLRWCTQIAKGMAYLEEECRLVHRDLAARNVLVQTPHHVRITDFGLAKMLEYGEEELKIFEGKMPIKWLALECIQYKRYTHKSDVWAYGVTVWELLTFGDKPYKNVPLQQIPQLLEQGNRLPQPAICSMDIYLILIKCWMVDANTRYTFRELIEEFSRMMKDPGRYLAIEGDALMRLPSYSSTDRRQMLEQLADDEDDESIREANDFLRGSSSSPGTPVSPFIPFTRDSTAATDPSTIAPNLVQEAARIRPGPRQSTSSHRYASDPVKKARFSMGKPQVFEAALPTDVDNYLVPDSQQRSSYSPTTDSPIPLSGSKGSLTYTPVIGDGAAESEIGIDYYEYLEKAKSGSQDDDLNRFSDHCMDNQEYMMPNNNNPKRFEDHLAAAPLIDSDRSMTEAETVV